MRVRTAMAMRVLSDRFHYRPCGSILLVNNEISTKLMWKFSDSSMPAITSFEPRAWLFCNVPASIPIVKLDTNLIHNFLSPVH
jgi:hypothetical protein